MLPTTIWGRQLELRLNSVRISVGSRHNKHIFRIKSKVSVKRNCDNCGQEVLKVIPNSKEKVEAIAVTCANCGITRTYKPRNEEFYISYNQSRNGVDPIFHLPLWLQGNVRGNLFWAYNRVTNF